MLTTQHSFWLKRFIHTFAIMFVMGIALPSQGQEHSISEVQERSKFKMFPSSVTLEPPNDDLPEDTVGGVGQ